METSRVVWFGDAGSDQKTEGGAGGGGVKDAEILFRGGTSRWRHSQTEMVWTCEEEEEMLVEGG